MSKNLISIFDLNAGNIWRLLNIAKRLKRNNKRQRYLSNKTLGLIFEKPSTRTSVSFSVAMYQMGGFPLLLDAKNLQRKRGETIQDTAHTLSRYLDGVVIRAFNHNDVQEFASFSDIPIINGLTNKEHPCQILGDILTILEKKNVKKLADFSKLKVAFIGDGNNVANSLLACCSLLGINFSWAGPKSYEPDKEIINNAKSVIKSNKQLLDILNDPYHSVKDSDVIYTDVWTSMGDETQKDKRINDFGNYQVNEELISNAKSNCIIMHCLPAHRGEEITQQVIDGPRSVVFDQAENRLHIQKAILLYLLG